jgi:hypothetical protein
MANPSGQLDLGGLQAEVSAKDPRHAQVHEALLDAINRLALSTGGSATGEITGPKPPDSVSVAVGGEFMHISIAHSGQLQRNIRYFSEISTSPAFAQPIVIDHGSSRTSHPFPLPTKDSGGHVQSYYVRSYAQYPGSPPSTPTVAGGFGSPTAFQMSGSTELTLLPSNGSGTAPNSGQSAGQGLGKTQTRQN